LWALRTGYALRSSRASIAFVALWALRGGGAHVVRCSRRFHSTCIALRTSGASLTFVPPRALQAANVCGAKMAVRIDYNRHAAGQSESTDAGNKGGIVNRRIADPDSLGFAINSPASDIDIKITSDTVATGKMTQCDVATAGCVMAEPV